MSLIVKPGETLTDEQISANKIEWVEEQILDLRRGFIDKLRCPYCQSLVEQNTEFCCVLMTRAVGAVLDKLAEEERMEAAEELYGKVN